VKPLGFLPEKIYFILWDDFMGGSLQGKVLNKVQIRINKGLRFELPYMVGKFLSVL